MKNHKKENLFVKLVKCVSAKAYKRNSVIPNVIKENSFENFFKSNKEFLETSYEEFLEKSKKIYKNTSNYFEIDFNVFCHLCWKNILEIKENKTFPLYTLLNGRLNFYFQISKFVNEYGSKIIEVSNNDFMETEKRLSSKELYKTTYLIYSSMLGVESYYFEMMYLAITESEFYKNLSENEKKKLSDLYEALLKTNLKHSLYYREYEKIKHDKAYTKTEKDFAYHLGVTNFDTWEFAFIILAYRHKDNKHFISLFTDPNFGPINIKDLNSLKYYANKFHNAYNVWITRKR